MRPDTYRPATATIYAEAMATASTNDNGPRAFPATMWTALLAARDPDAPEAVAARDEVCRAYWRPVFSYLQSLGLPHAEAEDVTQTVLSYFCHSGWMARVDREKGRLRHFLKATARHALYNFRRDGGAMKRGGGTAELRLDEIPDAETPASDAPSEAVFDRQWAWTVFDRAMHGLEESYALRGKAALLEALKPSLISADSVQHYSEIGSRFGVKEPQIRIEIHRLRRRLAERLHAEVAATLGPASTPAEIETETRYLVQILAHERTA